MNDGRRITAEEINECIANHPHKDVLEPFLAEAIAFGAEVYFDRNKCFSIIVNVPEMNCITDTGTKVVGLYMSVHGPGFGNNDKVNVWIAVDYGGMIRDGFAVGEYELAEGFKTIVYKAEYNAGICPFCNKDVGIKYLRHVGFADKACKDCYPAAKKEIEFPGWNN